MGAPNSLKLCIRLSIDIGYIRIGGKMKARRIATLLAAVTVSAGILAPVAPASAWTGLGCKFSTPNLKCKPNTSTSTYLDAATRSTQAWNSTATPIILTKVSSGANISVADGVFGNTGYDGITLNSSGNNPSCGSSGLWPTGIVTWWNRTYTDGYSVDKRQSVMVHELGHALGLAHSSASSCTNVPIMQPDTHTRWDVCLLKTPRADDINGVNALY